MAKGMSAEADRPNNIENALRTRISRRTLLGAAIGGAVGSVIRRENAQAQDVADNYSKEYTSEALGMRIEYPVTGYELEDIKNGIMLSKEDGTQIFITKEDLKEGDTAKSLLDESLKKYEENPNFITYGDTIEFEFPVHNAQEEKVKLPGWDIRAIPNDGGNATKFESEVGIIRSDINAVYRFEFTCPPTGEQAVEAGMDFDTVILGRLELLPVSV